MLVTQDQVAGNELSRTGDLAPANVRLQQRGVRIERRTIVREVRPAGGHLEVEVEDRFSGRRRTLVCSAVVDCGFRLPDEPLPGALGPRRRLRRPPHAARGRAGGPPRRAPRL